MQLILYFATFLNLSVSSDSVLVNTLGFSVHKVVSSNLHISISFSCLIALVRMFRTVLKRSGESGCPCVVPGLRGESFQSFSINYSNLWAFCIDIICQNEKASFYSQFNECYDESC